MAGAHTAAVGSSTDRPNIGLLEWRVWQQQSVPLSVAAGIAFHQAQGGTKAVGSPQEYMDALDLAAGALSRLIPIYVMDDVLHTRVTIDIDPLHGEFVAGATEYRSGDGTNFTQLSVVRGDLTSALSLMRRVGPALAFACAAAKDEVTASPEPTKEPKSQLPIDARAL